MIIPSKYLPPGRDLLTIGAIILEELRQPRTISELWERVRVRDARASLDTAYEWFVLAVTFSYAIGAIEMRKGVLSRRVSGLNDQ